MDQILIKNELEDTKSLVVINDKRAVVKHEEFEYSLEDVKIKEESAENSKVQLTDFKYSLVDVKIKEESTENSKVQLTDLPAEIFQLILRYLSFDNISKLRLVSRYFNDQCSSLLNSEFNCLRVVVQQRFLSLKAQMPRRESSRRKHPLARESDIIETLYMRLTLLNMTFGKHIERKYCCFFAGEIIDEIYKILQYVENTPSLSRAYKVTDELFDLSTMAMEYFKEHIEPSLPEVTYFASDVFEYPSFSSVKAQHSMLEETVAANSSEAAYPPPNCTLQILNKKFKILNKKVNRNTKELANMKRSLKAVHQKVNALAEVMNQMKWQQKSCDTTALPESHKINEILVQLNLCKHEIEHLNSKLLTSDQNTKLDWDALECSINKNFNYIGNNLNITSRCITNPRLRSLDMNDDSKELFKICSESLLSPFHSSVKRKFPSSTVTSITEWPEQKKKCTIEELSESVVIKEEPSSPIS